MKKLCELISSLSLAMGLGLILITYLDGRNPLMKFLTSGTSKVYILIFCIASILTSVFYYAETRKR